VVGSALITIVMVLGALVTSFVIRYDPSEHRSSTGSSGATSTEVPRWNP
jgi:hypothetical protein